MKTGHVIYIMLLLLLMSCGREKDFDATGTFEATEITVSGQEQGTIVYINADEGSKVRRGDTIALIDTMLLHHTKEQLVQTMQSIRKNIPDIETQLQPLREQAAKQNSEKERTRRMLADNAATQKQMDDMTSAAAILESELAAKESALVKSRDALTAQAASIAAQIAQTEERIARSVITAPADGTILARYIEAGELCTPGRAIYKEADMGNIYLRAYVTSGQLSQISIGDEVTVSAEYGGDKRREYTGRITWVSDKSEFTPKSIQTKTDRENMVYAIKIAVPNDGYIKIGMYGEVKFTGKTR